MNKMWLATFFLSMSPLWGEIAYIWEPGKINVTLLPSSNRALIRETRMLELPAGNCELTFTWAKANIESSFVTLSLDKGVVGEAIRPSGQERALVWRIEMPQAGAVQATLSYLVEGLKWQPSYILFFDEPAGHALLVGKLQLTNETGLAFRQAEWQIGAPGPALAEQPQPSPLPAGFVATRASLEPGEQALVPFVTLPDIPAHCRYVYQADRYGQNVERLLRLRLNQLGSTAPYLPAGPMLILSAHEPSLPLYKTKLEFQPGQEYEIDLGSEPDIVVERKLLSSRRSNFDFDRYGRVTGLDTTEELWIVARNHLAQEVRLEIIETMLSTWEYKGPPPVEKETSAYRWELPLPRGQSAELRFTIIKHSGTRAKK